MIKEIIASRIFNSRKETSILVTVKTDAGAAEASAPGGMSRGKHEAQPYSARGIDFSIELVNKLGKEIIRQKISIDTFKDLEYVERLARKLDNSMDWKILGANSLFALESALLKAGALEQGKELWQFLNENARAMPRLLGNCIGGGKHSRQKERPDFQEFLISPKTGKVFDSQFINTNAYTKLRRLLEQSGKYTGELTDENAYSPNLDAEQILDILTITKKEIESRFENRIDIGLDVAGSSLWNGLTYSYKNPALKRDQQSQIEYISGLIKKYNLFYVEDPLQEDDFAGFAKLLAITEGRCLICGDDLIATQFDRLEKAAMEKSINAVIIKPNQNGSLIETKRIIDLAKINKITCIISHRSGETLDATIADLAFAWQIPFIKTGIAGKERLAKINRLIQIEKNL